MALLIDRLMAELADGDWHMVSDSPETGVRKWVLVELVNGKFQVVVKTEHYAIGQLLDENRAVQNSFTGNERWGDWQHVARVPVNIWNREVGEAHDQGDDKYVDRWLNDSDHRDFRRFARPL